MSAISGDMITATPGRISAGIWKQTDLPPPVGITTSASRPEHRQFMTSAWQLRNDGYPKVPRNTDKGVRSRPAGFTMSAAFAISTAFRQLGFQNLWRDMARVER
jgi:hypothetical protein